MKKLTFIFLLLNLCNLIYAQTYKAIQDINVRKGPGTKFEIIGTISEGEIVSVITNEGNWSKINFDSDYGYISNKFIVSISSDDTKSEKTENASFNFSNDWPWVVGLLIFIGALYFFGLKRVLSALFPETMTNLLGKYECTKCGKTTIGRNSNSCPNGGQHNWYKIS